MYIIKATLCGENQKTQLSICYVQLIKLLNNTKHVMVLMYMISKRRIGGTLGIRVKQQPYIDRQFAS